jgi:hypothetical protein
MSMLFEVLLRFEDTKSVTKGDVGNVSSDIVMKYNDFFKILESVNMMTPVPLK